MRTKLANLFLVMAVSLATIALPLSVVRGEMSTAEDASKAAAILGPVFLKAVEAANAARISKSGSMVDVTALFSDFNQYKTVDPYIKYFKTMDIQPITAPGNQKYFLYFEFDFVKLRSLGYRSFVPRDRLVILFSTKSADSKEIIAFKVTIVNSGV